MKSISLLANACTPKEQPAQPAADPTAVTEEVINRIAEAVIAKLSAGQTQPTEAEGSAEPEPQPEEKDEGGEESEHGQPDEVAG